MPPNHVTKTHLKLSECLWCKAWADLGDILGEYWRMQGWFWVKMGLNLGKHWNVARSRSLIFFYEGGSHAKVIRAQLFIGWSVVFCVGFWAKN